MTSKLSAAGVALLVAMAEPAAAQGPRPVTWPAPERVSLAPSGVVGSWPARTSIVLMPDSLAVAPTHWRLGAIVGGTVFGTLGAGTAVALCQSDNPCRAPVWPALGAFLLAGGIGVALGALIGGQFPVVSP